MVDFQWQVYDMDRVVLRLLLLDKLSFNTGKLVCQYGASCLGPSLRFVSVQVCELPLV